MLSKRKNMPLSAAGHLRFVSMLAMLFADETSRMCGRSRQRGSSGARHRTRKRRRAHAMKLVAPGTKRSLPRSIRSLVRLHAAARGSQFSAKRY
jgi:hypothetical protein